MKATKQDCLDALLDAHYNPHSMKLLTELIGEHFSLIEHMKETSLFDVLEYEKKFAATCVEPMRILALDNERLKKEINKLRRKLGKIEKYKEM